jgi:general secretion pathway protein D
VVANAQDTEAIESLAKQLDIQRPIGTNNVHVMYLKNAQAKEAAESLAKALTNLRISGALETAQNIQVTADEGTNALIITASAQDYEVIAEIAEKLDIVREQVLVEMLIMEVSEDGLKEIGIDWATLDQAVAGSVRFFGATNFGLRSGFVSGDLEGLSVGAWKKSGTDSTIGPILHALEKVSGVNILSTPHILTSNHHKAKIIVGENRPFVTQSRITETTDLITPTVIKTFEYKDVGISLEITPHVSQGGLVRLEITSEFTKLIEDVTSPSTDTPTTAKREAQTVVSMNSGSTVVIGGLIRDDKVTIEKKIPFVSDIPLIGGLFRYEKDRLQKTNLLIFITPHVLGSQEDLTHITGEKKKEMKLKLKDGEKKNEGY